MGSRSSDETLNGGSSYEEQKPFLETGLPTHSLRADRTRGRISSIRASAISFADRQRRYWTVWFHLAVAIGYIFVTLLVWRYFEVRYSHGANVAYTPAREAIEYKYTRFAYLDNYDPKYFGKPSAKLDDAWERLLAPVNNWFTKDEIDRIGGAIDRSVVLPNGTYLGSTSMYHNLHCIKRIYRSLYQEHYFHEMTEEETELLQIHNMHCLNYLQQSVMCQGDMSPMVYKWHPTSTTPTAQMDYPHECVNFDAITNWARSRQVNPFTPGLVTHPELGSPFHNHEHNHVGAIIES